MNDPCAEGGLEMARMTFKLWRPKKDKAVMFKSQKPHIQACNLIWRGITIAYCPFGKN